jgi:hypothetical protein
MIIGKPIEPKKEKKVLDHEVMLEIKSPLIIGASRLLLNLLGSGSKPKLLWTSKNQLLVLVSKN